MRMTLLGGGGIGDLHIRVLGRASLEDPARRRHHIRPSPLVAAARTPVGAFVGGGSMAKIWLCGWFVFLGFYPSPIHAGLMLAFLADL